jgi:type I restriction enzyme S subunit
MENTIIENKQGFKETKFGWIPKDWDIYKLSEVLIDTKLGGNYKNITDFGGVPLIKMGNIGRGNITLGNEYFISKEEILSESHLLENKDILFNTRNTLELVGKVAIWKNEYPIAYYNSNLLKLSFNNKFISSKDFINFCLNSYNSIKQLRSFATGTTSVAAIYDRDVKSLKVILPKPSEQIAIADCLSTWDTAIAELDNLIKAKNLLKKGLMQQLLSGKKRLFSFNKEWEEKRLDFFFEERSERNSNGLQLLSIGEAGVYPQDNSNKKDTSNNDKSKYKKICVGDIGYNTMRMWQGRSALSSLEGIVSPAYTIVKPKKNTDSQFFAYLFKDPAVIHRFFRNSQGMVSDTLNCKFKDFAIIKLLLPTNEEEQIAIAQVLNTADQEINLLTNQRNQLQLQKKGLMQQLLTGKKRLKV